MRYQIFSAITETGSISQAAVQLNLSAPAVSKQLSKLEQELQVELFHRSHKKLDISDAGRRFYPKCKSILSAISQAEDELLSTKNEVQGALTITLSPALNRSVLFDALSAFSARYPKVQLDIRISDKLEDLHDDNLDFAFRLGDLADNSHMIGIPLTTTKLVACATPEYLARHGHPTHLTDLGNCKLILQTPLHRSRALRTFFNQHQIRPESLTAHLCNDIEGVYQAVRSGLGIGLMLDISLQQELRTDKFCQLFEQYQLPQKKLYLMYKSAQQQTQKITAFKEHIKTFFQDDRTTE